MCVCVCVCVYVLCYMYMVAVFIWQTPLAVAHVQRVSSVDLQVSPIHLDCVRQDFTAQGETQQPQVGCFVFFELISVVLEG